MSSEESWAEQAENKALFESDDEAADLAQLLEISPTNRTIANANQARLLASLRYVAWHFAGKNKIKQSKDYAGMGFLADTVEAYQLTLAGEYNSRVQFIKAYIGKILASMTGKTQKPEEFK